MQNSVLPSDAQAVCDRLGISEDQFLESIARDVRTDVEGNPNAGTGSLTFRLKSLGIEGISAANVASRIAEANPDLGLGGDSAAVAIQSCTRNALTGVASLSAEQKAICAQLGISPTEFASSLNSRRTSPVGHEASDTAASVARVAQALDIPESAIWQAGVTR
jgi:hypothetical protein